MRARAGRRAQCRLKNWMARSCWRAASRVLNVPRFRLLPVRGSFFLEYRRYFPDGSFRIIARLLEDSTALGSGPAGQLSQERSPLRPFAESRVGIDVPGPRQNDQTAAPGPREELATRKRREWIVGARHHDARKWKARERHGAEAAHLVGGVD